MNIGEKIKQARNSKGLTQEELAKKTGIARVSIGNYERGDRIPPSDVLIKIANTLNVELSTLAAVENKEVFNKIGNEEVSRRLKEGENSLIEIIKSINQKEFQQPLDERLIHGVIKETMEFISFSLYKKHKINKMLDEKIKNDGYLESIKVMDDKVYKYKTYFPTEEGE